MADSEKKRKKKAKKNPAAAKESGYKARRKRRHNPAGYSRADMMNAAGAGLAGAAVGAISGGLDKTLNPDLIASGPKRGAVDLAVGVGAGLALGMMGQKGAGLGAIGGGGALFAERLVRDFALTAEEKAALAAAEAKREIEKKTGAAATNGNGATTNGNGNVAKSLRPRIIPSAPALPAASGGTVSTPAAASVPAGRVVWG